MNANKQPLMIVAVLLLAGILGAMLWQQHQAKEHTVGGQINEAVEEIGDEIDDHTTTK